MTTLRPVLAFFSLVALSFGPGCSLARSALGSPTGTDAFVSDGGLDAADHDAGTDAGIDASDFDAGDFDAGDIDAYVDMDGGLDGGVDADLDGGPPDAFALDMGVDAYVPPDTGCVIGTSSCLAYQLWVCDPDGISRLHESCDLGCDSTAPAHCRQLRATHVTDETLLPSGSTPLVVSAGQTVVIDTSTGAITLLPMTVLRAAGASSSAGAIGFSTQTQVGGPELGIFTFSTITIESGAQLQAVGARALVMLASGDVVIDGTIDVGARGTIGGPAGYAGGGHRADGAGPSHGAAGDIQGLFNDLMSGGGGGGHGGAGGRGGDEDAICCATASGGAGGGATAADASGAPLLGGSGGGGGADGSNGGVGGGGGGVVQISSLTMIHVTATGLVSSPGEGGGHGDQAGGGGGAGGTIFLEALTVTLDGTVAVNGGAGGGGSTGGSNGGRGTSTTTAAAGGSGGGGGGGGGSGAAAATISGAGGGQGNGGGGGGGAGGRISFVTMSGSRGTTGTVTPVDADREAAATIR